MGSRMNAYHRPEALELLQRRWHVVWRLRRAAHLSAVPEDGRKERDIVERGDFWPTSHKQLNFVQHVKPCSRKTTKPPQQNQQQTERMRRKRSQPPQKAARMRCAYLTVSAHGPVYAQNEKKKKKKNNKEEHQRNDKAQRTNMH